MVFWHERHERTNIFAGNQAFYVNALLRGVVYSLVGVFTPIFVYKEILKIADMRLAIAAVALYYLVLRLTVLLSAIQVSHYIEKYGFRKSVAISMLFFIVSLFGLSLSENRVWVLPLAAVSAGLVIPFYWIARHSAIAQDTDKREIGKTVSYLATLESLSSLLAPFVGGVIIVNWGYPVL